MGSCYSSSKVPSRFAWLSFFEEEWEVNGDKVEEEEEEEGGDVDRKQLIASQLQEVPLDMEHGLHANQNWKADLHRRMPGMDDAKVMLTRDTKRQVICCTMHYFHPDVLHWTWKGVTYPIIQMESSMIQSK